MNPLFRLLAVSALFLPSTALAGDACVGWGVGGAVAGVSVGFYGLLGVYALRGDPWGWGEGPVGMVSVIAAEEAGLVLGPVATCALFHPEPTVVPRASWVTGFGSLGLAAGLGAGFLYMDAVTPPGDYLPPYASLPALLLATGGAVGGGVLGSRAYERLRGDVELTLAPMGAGAVLEGRF